MRRWKKYALELEDELDKAREEFGKAVRHAAVLEVILGEQVENALKVMNDIEASGEPIALLTLMEQGRESYLDDFLERTGRIPVLKEMEER